MAAACWLRRITMTLEIINPGELGSPRGYSNGMLAPAGGRLLFVAGQVAFDVDQRITESAFTAQFARALENVLAVVRAAGGEPCHVARLTIYVTDKNEYSSELAAIGREYRRLM